MEQIRDIFVFCCYTGLAFIDAKTLEAKHLVEGNSGEIWIRKKRIKTGNMCNIPLLRIPATILEKYRESPECQKKGTLLPVKSNQKMNSYLKELADICGIEKEISTHCARHTFATTVTLANDVSLKSVSKMLGHSSTKMTEHYARVLDRSVFSDMLNVDNCFAKMS